MSIIYLSEQANLILKNYLKSKGHTLFEIRETSTVYNSISSHADIYLCKLFNELVVSHELLPFIKDHLLNTKVSFYVGDSSLGYNYPENIKYNAVHLGKHFIHNTKHTDPKLLSLASLNKLNIIQVKQGYTKCNLVVIDENSVITSDLGLANSLISNGIEVLIISQGYVKLTGFHYGFLGGASGRVGNEIIFNGNLSVHSDYKNIKAFIESRNLIVTQFEDYELEDIGSIIEIEV